MKIHEYQAQDMFRRAGIPVCDGAAVTTQEEALREAQRLGYPVVLKAQVLAGGRGKAGGVKVAADAGELKDHFSHIQGMVIKGYRVETVFVVKAAAIVREFYLSVVTDPARNDVVVIASPAGGVDIEETARTAPEQIKKFYLEGGRDPRGPAWEAFLASAFAGVPSVETAEETARKLIGLFFDNDCLLAEINPLVIDNAGRWVAADAKVNFDDNALFRHPDILALRDLKAEDPDELEAKEKNLSFVKLDGNVGCIVNGAGLAMATMDVIQLVGGHPANFLDVGGSSNPEKVLNALRIILRNKGVKSILVNIFGGITRCDDIANGIVEARRQMTLSVPMVVRLTGTNEKEAKEILAREGIGTYSSMRETVEKAVALTQGPR